MNQTSALFQGREGKKKTGGTRGYQKWSGEEEKKRSPNIGTMKEERVAISIEKRGGERRNYSTAAIFIQGAERGKEETINVSRSFG